MTNGELIAELSKLPSDADVVMWDDLGNEHTGYPYDFMVIRKPRVVLMHPNSDGNGKYVLDINKVDRHPYRWEKSSLEDNYDSKQKEVIVLDFE